MFIDNKYSEVLRDSKISNNYGLWEFNNIFLILEIKSFRSRIFYKLYHQKSKLFLVVCWTSWILFYSSKSDTSPTLHNYIILLLLFFILLCDGFRVISRPGTELKYAYETFVLGNCERYIEESGCQLPSSYKVEEFLHSTSSYFHGCLAIIHQISNKMFGLPYFIN